MNPDFACVSEEENSEQMVRVYVSATIAANPGEHDNKYNTQAAKENRRGPLGLERWECTDQGGYPCSVCRPCPNAEISLSTVARHRIPPLPPDQTTSMMPLVYRSCGANRSKQMPVPVSRGEMPWTGARPGAAERKPRDAGELRFIRARHPMGRRRFFSGLLGPSEDCSYCRSLG
ncbi:hypothetical protein VTG60DRAFT_2640 [Thermothelomyces hinnuleus]